MKTPSMTTYDRKTRPAVVISSQAFNESRSDVIIAGLTTNLSREHFVGQMVLADWAECGLVRPSAVSGIIQTIRENQIRERVGKLSPADKRRFDALLREVFDL
jgi:mRNA-degrading endonuclease toxin of MazEF toxin-antitoxin module